MSNVDTDPGYWMDCFNGIHEFENGRCLHCEHREVVLDFSLPNKTRRESH